MGPHHQKRVAVIGAGISGVVAAAHLKREGLDVTVFERSMSAGGIWVFDERQPLEPRYPSLIPSRAEEHYDEGKDEVQDDQNQDIAQLRHAPPGPCYVGLKNNVATPLLQTTLNAFPPGTPDFVTHNVLRDYIQDTAVKTGVHERTQYNTAVTKLQKVHNTWKLETLISTSQAGKSFTRTTSIAEFDAIVVASGHYHAPRIPDTPGLATWKAKWPDRIQHSKSYRRAEDFKGSNFLLVGGGVSSVDIARELSPFANHIYQSNRNGAFDLPAGLLPDNATRVDEVVSFDNIRNDSSLKLADSNPLPGTITLKSGRKLCDIHHIILATGYHVTLPFLPDLHSDTTPPHKADEALLVSDGTQLHNLHKDIFYIRDPSLVFVGVPYFTATFTLFEFQAMVVAKVLSGQTQLPNERAMRGEYGERIKVKGYGKAFHSLRDREVEYVDELLEWVNADLRKAGKAELKGHSNIWHRGRREQVERIKAMFAAIAPPGKELQVVCP